MDTEITEVNLTTGTNYYSQRIEELKMGKKLGIEALMFQFDTAEVNYSLLSRKSQ